jgi:hypothetical protein
MTLTPTANEAEDVRRQPAEIDEEPRADPREDAHVDHTCAPADPASEHAKFLRVSHLKELGHGERLGEPAETGIPSFFLSGWCNMHGAYRMAHGIFPIAQKSHRKR